jgi:hypothetical protein
VTLDRKEVTLDRKEMMRVNQVISSKQRFEGHGDDVILTYASFRTNVSSYGPIFSNPGSQITK